MVASIESVARKIIDYTIHNSDLEGSLAKYDCLIIDESKLFWSSSLELIHLTYSGGTYSIQLLISNMKLMEHNYIDLLECDMGSNM